LDLLEFLGTGNDLELLYLGKVALEHIGLVEELRWRRVLKPALLRPRYLDVSGAAARAARLRQGVTVFDLVA
jgi:hypothetical protein